MSTNAESLAPASQPDDKDLRPEVQEVFPVTMWEKGLNEDAEMYDFTPKVVTEEEVLDEEGTESPDPKASSAPDSALAAAYLEVRTEIPDSWRSPMSPASVDKDNTPPSPDESGSQTSSTEPTTSAGKKTARA